MTNPELLVALRHDILKVCFDRFDKNFAGGDLANNKLFLDRVEGHPSLRIRVVKLMAEHDFVINADFITAVPDGANWLGKDIANERNLPFIGLKKRKSLISGLAFAGPSALRAYKKLSEDSQGTVVEDTFNTFTSTNRVLSMDEMKGRVNKALAIFDRGNPDNRHNLEIPHAALISEHIPAQLSSDSALWEFIS
ncbi:MAG: hypothetical protein AAB459_00725, partial [Patescibacteria group bacterium]